MADRFYCPDPAIDGQITLGGDEARHLATVLRAGPGRVVEVFDGRGTAHQAVVVAIDKRRIILRIEHPLPRRELPCRLTLGVAPPKGDRLDWLVEKATELGVARLLPVITRRTVVERIKGERLASIAVEAAEQCGRTLVPEIAEPVGLDALLSARDPGRTLYFADETGGESLGTAFAPGPALILTGPEGGFTPEERAAIRAAPGVRPVSLGPRILRAETAALAGVAAWMALAGDWR